MATQQILSSDAVVPPAFLFTYDDTDSTLPNESQRNQQLKHLFDLPQQPEEVIQPLTEQDVPNYYPNPTENDVATGTGAIPVSNLKYQQQLENEQLDQLKVQHQEMEQRHRQQLQKQQLEQEQVQKQQLEQQQLQYQELEQQHRQQLQTQQLEQQQLDMQVIPFRELEQVAPDETLVSVCTQYQCATLYVPSVGQFKDMRSNIGGLPSATISVGESSIERLLGLKKIVNELEKRRKKYHCKMGGAAVTGIVAAPLTFGASLVASGAGNIHHSNRIKQIKGVIVQVLHQINQVRLTFELQPGWQNAENSYSVDKSIFKRGIKRSELHGHL